MCVCARTLTGKPTLSPKQMQIRLKKMLEVADGNEGVFLFSTLLKLFLINKNHSNPPVYVDLYKYIDMNI